MEYKLYQKHIQKLKDFCEQTGLDFHLNCCKYPITLELTPNRNYRQESLFDAQDTTKPTFTLMTFALFNGEISYSATESVAISDANFSKLKGIFQKISTYWTQYVFKKAALNPDLTLDDLWCESGIVTDDD